MPGTNFLLDTNMKIGYQTFPILHIEKVNTFMENELFFIMKKKYMYMENSLKERFCIKIQKSY